MHIVHILPELNQGGVERLLGDLTRELVARGHLCTVISAGGQQAGQIEKDGGTHIRQDVCSKNPLTVPFRVHKLQTTLTQLQPDILHVHSRVPAWLTWFANKKLRIPFITSVHGFNSVSKYSEIMTLGDRVICVSHPVKDYIQQHYPVPDSKIKVIHPGINPDEFNPGILDLDWMDTFKTQYGLSGKYVITTVGRITELKDYETFVQAVALCSKENPEIRGLIVGGIRHDKQTYYTRLQDFVRKQGMEKYIVFAGSHTHIAEIYALSDILVSCSKKPESFGLTLIEALAMNTPVIATRHGGPLDIVREGENGTLFAPQNPEELSQRIISLNPLKNNALRTNTLEHFGLKRMVDATLALYETVLKPVK